MQGAKAIVRPAVWLAGGLLVSALGGCGGALTPESNDFNHSTVANLLAFNSTTPPTPARPAGVEEALDCPQIEVLDGTASDRVFGGAGQGNDNVRYQFSMGEVVRECSHVGGNLMLKVGVEGRALLGPAGAPGTFSAPVRVAVRREKDSKIVSSTLLSAPVTIASGQTQAAFNLVSEPIGVPFVSEHGDADYTIIVGFDSKGQGAASPQKRRRRKA